MILRAEPRRIMRFMEDNFELLRDLYKVQLTQQVIPEDAFQAITRHKGDTVTNRLTGYEILRRQGDDYRMAEEIGAYVGYLTKEFKPLLPEQLRRYRGSIDDLYQFLNARRDHDPETHALRLERLYDEIQSFLDNVTNNTATLLKRTQQLKVNRQQLSYAERLHEATQLIQNYIDPLTQIVDLRDDNSIASLLANIGRNINLDRLDGHGPRVGDRYGQLDALLRRVNQHLLRESDVIRRELTPLIDRIQRESEVLAGFLTFLENPLLSPVPDIGHRHQVQPFGNQTQADLRMYVEQFQRARERKPIKVGEGLAVPAVSIFNRAAYRRRLDAALPMDNFFAWAEATLAPLPERDRERFLLALVSLLFGDDGRYALTFHAEYRTLSFTDFRYRLPRVAVVRRAPQPARP